jgi:hypothetical protein
MRRVTVEVARKREEVAALATTVAVLIPGRSLRCCQFRFSRGFYSLARDRVTCYHFDVITSVGNYSRTCRGDAVRSGTN